MKKIIIALFLLSISCIISAQVTWQSLDSLILNTEIKDSVKNYYKYVYKAEKKIIKGKYKKAALLYKEAFNYLDNPFMKDLGMALKCEIKGSREEENIKKYIYLLINKHGYKTGFLENQDYRELSNWPDIEAMIDTINPDFDTIVVNKLNKIEEDDQDYRLQCKIKYNGNTYNEFTTDSIEIIDSLNYSKIVKIIESQEYISEELLGNKFHIIDLIVAHNRWNLTILELLHKSMVAGKLDARSFAYSLANSDHSTESEYNLGFTSVGIKIADGTYAYFKPDLKSKRKINNYRKKLYLEPVEDFHKKMIWQMQNSQAGFNFRSSFTFVLDDDQYFDAITNKIFLGKKSKNMKIYYLNSDYKKERLKEAKAWQKEQNELKKSGKK